MLIIYYRIANSANENEVERAKNKLTATMLMQLDGPSAVCENIGRQMLSVGRVLSPAEIYLRIKGTGCGKRGGGWGGGVMRKINEVAVFISVKAKR